MDIFEINNIVKEICMRKGLIIQINEYMQLYPDLLSSLEATELLLIIDKHNNKYCAAKLGLNNLTTRSIYNTITK